MPQLEDSLWFRIRPQRRRPSAYPRRFVQCVRGASERQYDVARQQELATHVVVLFIGIAVLVYYFFFKLLGIILFLLEIIWFIVFPVIGLLRSWWEMRVKIIKIRRFYVTAFIFASLITLFIYPWNSVIKVPAVYKSLSTTTLFTPTHRVF